MVSDLLTKLEQKVQHAVDLIELLRLQIEELEEENAALRCEQEQWREDLGQLIKRFDNIEAPTQENGQQTHVVRTEEAVEL